MAVLVTRPQPDDEATAAALRARGFEVLSAPVLRFEPLPFQDDGEVAYGGVIVTSANALRGIASRLKGGALLKLPLFSVGEHTASAAREAGFENVISAGGDAGALRDRVLASVKARELKKTSPLLYLAGADLARDLAGELGRARLHRGDADDLPDGGGAWPAARSRRRVRRQRDRGSAALLPAQRPGVPGGGAGFRR